MYIYIYIARFKFLFIIHSYIHSQSQTINPFKRENVIRIPIFVLVLHHVMQHNSLLRLFGCRVLACAVFVSIAINFIHAMALQAQAKISLPCVPKPQIAQATSVHTLQKTQGPALMQARKMLGARSVELPRLLP